MTQPIIKGGYTIKFQDNYYLSSDVQRKGKVRTSFHEIGHMKKTPLTFADIARTQKRIKELWITNKLHNTGVLQNYLLSTTDDIIVVKTSTDTRVPLEELPFSNSFKEFLKNNGGNPNDRPNES